MTITIPYIFQDFQPNGPPQPIMAEQLNANFSAIINGLTASVLGPSQSVVQHLPVFSNTTGNEIVDPSSNFTFPLAGSPISGGVVDLAVVSMGPGIESLAEMDGASVVQGIVSKMLVPGTYTQAPWPCTNFSAYLIDENNNANEGSSAVNYFGFALVGAANSSVWNFNSVATNCPSSPWSAVTGMGLDFGIINGIELDFNLCKVGSAQPVGQCNAIAINGASELGVSPQSDSYAIHVFALDGAGAAMTPWDFGLATEAGACIAGVLLGPALPLAGQLSQYIALQATGPGTYTTDYVYGILQADNAGNLNLDSTSGLVTAPSFVATGSNGYYLTTDLGDQPILYYGNDQIVINDAAQHQSIIIQSAPRSPLSVYRNSVHTFQSIAGVNTYATLSPIGGAESTSLQLLVSNNAGANLVNVILGPADTPVTGYRCLLVPD